MLARMWCTFPGSLTAVVFVICNVFRVTSCALAVGVTLKTRAQMHRHIQFQVCPNSFLIRPWCELDHLYSVKTRSHHHFAARLVCKASRSSLPHGRRERKGKWTFRVSVSILDAECIRTLRALREDIWLEADQLRLDCA